MNSLDTSPRRQRSFSPHLLHALKTVTSYNVFPKGVSLFAEGQPASGVFFLMKGGAKLSLSSKQGEMLILSIARPGDILGLSATLSGKPHQATAETIAASRVGFVKPEDFWGLLRKRSEVCYEVVRFLSSEVCAGYEQVRCLGSASSAERLAALLLRWCVEWGEETEQGVRLRLPLTLAEFSQMISVRRETVSRLLANFRRNQIISLKGSTLYIHRKAALASLARPKTPSA